MIGMKVEALVCDGVSQNRKVFVLHKLANGINMSPDGVTCWVYNRIDPEQKRKVHFFSDLPHLKKTLRNKFENSNVDGTRHLMVSELKLI